LPESAVEKNAPVEEQPAVVQMDSEPKPQPAEPDQGVWTGRMAWAAVVVLPLFAYAGWLLSTADLRHPDNLTIADLNPFQIQAKAIYSEREGDAAVDSEPIEKDYTVALLESDEEVVTVSFTDPAGAGIPVRLKSAPKPAPPVNTYVATPQILAMRYHVVGGCFSELGNARGLVDDLRSKGYSAYILDHHKGLYRVTYGNYARRSEALKALRRVKNNEMEAAWLLVQ